MCTCRNFLLLYLLSKLLMHNYLWYHHIVIFSSQISIVISPPLFLFCLLSFFFLFPQELANYMCFEKQLSFGVLLTSVLYVTHWCSDFPFYSYLKNYFRLIFFCLLWYIVGLFENFLLFIAVRFALSIAIAASYEFWHVYVSDKSREHY